MVPREVSWATLVLTLQMQREKQRFHHYQIELSMINYQAWLPARSLASFIYFFKLKLHRRCAYVA